MSVTILVLILVTIYVQLQLTLMVFLLKILLISCKQEKNLTIIFKNILVTLLKVVKQSEKLGQKTIFS